MNIRMGEDTISLVKLGIAWRGRVICVKAIWLFFLVSMGYFNAEDHALNSDPISILPPCDQIQPHHDEKPENKIRRHISSDNISGSLCAGASSNQSCYPYMDQAMTSQEIYSSNHSQRGSCCKRPTDISRQNGYALNCQKTDSSTCSCMCSHHHCLSPLHSLPPSKY